MNKIWPIGIQGGVIMCLALLVYELLLPRIDALSAEVLYYLPWVCSIYSAHQYYKAANHGQMSYWEGVLLGLIMSVFTAVIFVLLVYLYMKYADADMIKTTINGFKEALSSKRIKGAELEEIMQIAEHASPELVSFVVGLGIVLPAGVTTFLVSAFSKSTNKASHS